MADQIQKVFQKIQAQQIFNTNELQEMPDFTKYELIRRTAFNLNRLN